MTPEMQNLLDAVLRAMDDCADTRLSRSDYIEAMDEIESDAASRSQCARECPEWQCEYCGGLVKDSPVVISAFARLWNSISGERASWASNPWCWAVTFRRVEVEP